MAHLRPRRFVEVLALACLVLLAGLAVTGCGGGGKQFSDATATFGDTCGDVHTHGDGHFRHDDSHDDAHDGCAMKTAMQLDALSWLG